MTNPTTTTVAPTRSSMAAIETQALAMLGVVGLLGLTSILSLFV